MNRRLFFQSSDGLIIYNLFTRLPEPKPQILADYYGLTENEILQKFPYADLERKKEGSDICLQIRLSDATIMCIFNENKICQKGYLFSDY